MTVSSPGTRGRPRDTAIDEVVLSATVRLLAERGYTGLRVDDVAARARVAKTTVYRRWPSLAHLAVAAIERALGDRTVTPTGDLLADADRLVEVALTPLTESGRTLLAAALAVHEQQDAELRTRYRTRIIDPVRDQAVALIRDGVERGQLVPGTDAEALADAVIGGLVYRLAVLGEPVGQEEARSFVRAVLHGTQAPH